MTIRSKMGRLGLAGVGEMPWHAACEQITPLVFKIETPSGYGTAFLFAMNKSASIVAIATAYHVISEAEAWKLPVKIRHHSSGKEQFLEAKQRPVLIDRKRDSAAIIIPAGMFPAASKAPALLQEKKHFKVGVALGWMGYPSIADGQLCFFQGVVSAFIPQSSTYLLDGVAVHGVSGGPVFAATREGPRLAGIVSAYFPNRRPDGTLPGLMKAMDLSHFHATIGALRSIDDALEKAEAERKASQAATQPPANDASPVLPPTNPPQSERPVEPPIGRGHAEPG